MNGIPASLSVASDIAKQRATASALLLAAGKVGAKEAPIPFSWRVEHIAGDPPSNHFALYILPEQDCRCFLFHASPSGQTRILHECRGKANIPIRIPPSKDFIWDGKDDSLLVIVTAGVPCSDRSELSPWRGEEEYHASDIPLALDSKALGLV